MTDRERRVITMLYKDEMTQERVAKVMGLTQSSICKIRKKAMEKLERQEVV